MTQARPVRTLPEEECWARLEEQELGRLAYHLAGEVHVSPVNYAVHAGRILLRTAEGSKLLGVVMNPDVALEIDEVDDEDDTAWSVVARGTARILAGREAREADQLRLRPWVGPDKHEVVAIEVTELTGRAFQLARPWQHMLPPQQG